MRKMAFWRHNEYPYGDTRLPHLLYKTQGKFSVKLSSCNQQNIANTPVPLVKCLCENPLKYMRKKNNVIPPCPMVWCIKGSFLEYKLNGIFSTIQLISEHIIYKVPTMWEVQGIVFGPSRQEDITIQIWHNWIIRLHLIKAEVA